MRISSTLDNDIQFISKIPNELQHFQISGSAPYTGIGNFGSVFFQKLIEKRYTFWYSIYRPIENVTIRVHQTTSWLGFRVMLKHHIRHVINGHIDAYLQQGQFNFVYSPTIENSFDLKKGIEYCTFDMLLHRDILGFVKREDNLLESFFAAIDKRHTTLLAPFASWCNIHTQDAIELLMKYPRNEALVIEIVKSLLENVSDNADNVYLSENDVEAIFYARNLIRQNIQSHISISALAKKSGINSRLLKYGFSKIFKKTPYQYLLYERLKLARQILEHSNLPIKTIAERTGFHFDTSFIKAFKKEFHQTPHAWRRKSLRK